MRDSIDGEANDVPLVPEDYIHRVGRTARAEATGDAFTFVAPDEESDLRRIEAAIKKRLPRITVPDFDYNFVQTGPTDDTGMPTEMGYIGGGMFQRDPDIGRPIITIEVDDMDSAIAAIAANGGTTVREPQPVGDMGVAAYFSDSEGNLMGLWQSLGSS